MEWRELDKKLLRGIGVMDVNAKLVVWRRP